MCSANNNEIGSMKCGFIGFMVGFLAGAVTALFLTTKTGKELREDIKRVIIEVRDKVEKEASKVKNLTKEKYTEILNNVISNYKKVKELTEKEIELIKNIIMEQKEIIK
jgi:gas vesicle protein